MAKYPKIIVRNPTDKPVPFARIYDDKNQTPSGQMIGPGEQITGYGIMVNPSKDRVLLYEEYWTEHLRLSSGVTWVVEELEN